MNFRTEGLHLTILCLLHTRLIDSTEMKAGALVFCWRDMKWDPVERVFYYDKQGTPPAGVPTADANGYYFVSPTNNDVEVRVVFDQSKDIMMKGYENELKDLLERLDKMEVPKNEVSGETENRNN